ncbi:MAG TPA: CoA protein activase [Firmicutes bacterium]|nr:CoA protein activase [Bacillota bacterium]
MKVTFPHMGHIYIPLRAFFTALGVEVVVPPPVSRETLSLGTRYAPEFACLPLKVNVGNFLEAARKGADTVVMAGGVGPCRFGYYAQVEQEILRDLGVNLRMVVLEPPQGHWRELRQGLRDITGGAGLREIWRAGRLAWRKLTVLDELEHEVHRARAQEGERGATTRAWQRILHQVDEAGSVPEVEEAARRGKVLLKALPRREGEAPLRIGIVGEIYTVLEPAVNLELERVLGEMGAIVERSIYLSDWVKTNLVLHSLHLRDDREEYRLAAPYLGHFVGGHGLESISWTVRYARAGFDGVIQLAPLTCMPEIVAESILPEVSRDVGIPVLTFMLDEHASEVGVRTRLEAFYDLLCARRRQKEGGTAFAGVSRH